MFFGGSQTRVDEKGRLKIPADFKRELEEGQKFFITSLDGSRALLYPLQEWMRKLQSLMKMPPSHPARTKFLQVTARWGATVEMDAQGRVLLPDPLRAVAKLMSAEVTVIFTPTEVSESETRGILEVINREQFERETSALTAADFDAMTAYGV